MSADTTATPDTGTRWPWHFKVTLIDGTIEHADHADGDAAAPILSARFVSQKPGVERVELTTSFVNGEQVSPAKSGE